MRSGIYVRVSTDDQRDNGYSIDSQLRMIKEYYNKNEQLYCEQTLIGNLQENYEEFLSRLPKKAYILDFGCGSVRNETYT